MTLFHLTPSIYLYFHPLNLMHKALRLCYQDKYQPVQNISRDFHFLRMWKFQHCRGWNVLKTVACHCKQKVFIACSTCKWTKKTTRKPFITTTDDNKATGSSFSNGQNHFESDYTCITIKVWLGRKLQQGCATFLLWDSSTTRNTKQETQSRTSCYFLEAIKESRE